MPDSTNAEQAVRKQDEQRIHAQMTADTIALRRIYADDFLGIGPTGVVRNKAQVIADFTSHELTYQRSPHAGWETRERHPVAPRRITHVQ